MLVHDLGVFRGVGGSWGSREEAHQGPATTDAVEQAGTAELFDANGYGSLYLNTEGYDNTASGNESLYSNSGGYQNTAFGAGSLYSNDGGNRNTAIGWQSLYLNTGDYNIALGVFAGDYLTTGDHNIDIGNHGIGGESNTIRIGSDDWPS